tara:strand:+ start:2309 stop:2434 length:126 start_codon:yes stop_codon:yes gene_type:complete
MIVLDIAEVAVNFMLYAFGVCCLMVSILIGLASYYIVKDKP